VVLPQRAIASIFFNTGSSTLDNADRFALDQMIQKMKTLGIVKITITGFADGQGLTGGQKLSRARAQSVANYLRSQHVEVNMIVAGKGVPLSTKLNQQSSRRVDISAPVDAAKS
jgi:outer membrane protein OmpA-like peptidoglycan-associated protein